MSAIRAGDLVMVVRTARCGCTTYLGRIFTVKKVGLSSVSGMKCAVCGDITQQQYVAYWPDWSATALYRLIRIDPPALPETIEREQELTS